jgi:hypothetical protein
MTIEYNISHDGLRIETYPKGMLDIKETIDYFTRIKNDHRIKQGAVEIVYFKYVIDFNITLSEIEKITKSYQEPKNAQMIAATIFVCETDLAYGIGRMLQTFHEITNPKHKVVLARSESELKNIVNLISHPG